MAAPKKIFYYIYDIKLMLLLVLVFLCICCYLNFLWRKRNMFIKSWNHPGPFNFPIIGAGYYFMTHPEHIFGRMLALHEKYQEGFKLWFGNRLVYALHNPEEIEKILGSTKLVKKDALYNILLADSIGEGLLTALQTALGLQLDSQKNNHHYVDALDKSMSLLFLKGTQLWYHIDCVWEFLGHDRELQTSIKTFMDLIDKVLKQKMEVVETKKQKKSLWASIEEGPRKRLAFLDYIMENGQFNTQELRDELSIFVIAATDTTAVALSFLFAVLGMFPDVQQKVLEEVTEVLGIDRLPKYKDLPHMVYTERVIKETLRLFPPGFFLRHITEDVDMGDFVIPKDATVYFGLVFIHRNPKYWPDPLKFDPDRFLPEEVAKRHPCTYLPFSHGPRNCIGLKYGMMSMKVLIATVIRKFKFDCDYKKIEDIKLKANLILRFKDDPKITLIPREK